MRNVKFTGIDEGLKVVYVFEIGGQLVEFTKAYYVDKDTGLHLDGYYPAFWAPDIREVVDTSKTNKFGEHPRSFEVHPYQMAWEDDYNDEYYEERFEILRELNEHVPWDYEIDWAFDMDDDIGVDC